MVRMRLVRRIATHPVQLPRGLSRLREISYHGMVECLTVVPESQICRSPAKAIMSPENGRLIAPSDLPDTGR